MTPDEYRAKLESMTPGEMHKFNRAFVGDIRSVEARVREFADNRIYEQRICYLLGLQTEDEKRTQALDRSVKAAAEATKDSTEREEQALEVAKGEAETAENALSVARDSAETARKSLEVSRDSADSARDSARSARRSANLAFAALVVSLVMLIATIITIWINNK